MGCGPGTEEREGMGGVNRHTPVYQGTKEALQGLAATKCNVEE